MLTEVSNPWKPTSAGVIFLPGILDLHLRSWAPKVLMCQATGLGSCSAIETNRSCRSMTASIQSFHHMKRERLRTFSFFLHSFASFPSRESGYRCSVLFAGTKAWHIRTYGAQLRTLAKRLIYATDKPNPRASYLLGLYNPGFLHHLYLNPVLLAPGNASSLPMDSSRVIP